MIHERLRGEVLKTRRYTNLRLPLPLPLDLGINYTKFYSMFLRLYHVVNQSSLSVVLYLVPVF